MMRFLVPAALLWTSFLLGTVQAQGDVPLVRQPHLFDISQLEDSAILKRCRDDLVSIDADSSNNDLKIDREEYVAFLQLQSGNQMTGEPDDVPLRLEAIYHSHACWCDIVDPDDPNCCLFGNDHLPLNTSLSPLIEPYLQFFCSNIQNGLEVEGLAQPLVTILPTAAPTTLEPTSEPSLEPTELPSLEPTKVSSSEPTGVPTLEPTEMPSMEPTVIPSLTPSLTPTLVPTETPIEPTTEIPTTEPTTTDAPTPAPTTENPTSEPTTDPTAEPSLTQTTEDSNEIPPTVCVDFQYTVRNSQGLDADAILSAENNTVLDDLITGTTTIMTDILNGTYPPEQRQLQQQQQQYKERRHLAYFSNDFPVSITSATDKADCEGSDTNPDISCVTIASTVCGVLEDEDDPLEVRGTMIAGLQYAVESGDFPEQQSSPTQAPTPTPPPSLCIDFQYVVRNQVGLDADAIANEEDNNVLQGLRLSTRNITIEILNGTYPAQRRLASTESNHLRTAITANSRSNNKEEEEQITIGDFSVLGRRLVRQRMHHSMRRHLAYYSDDLPVTINAVTDNPLCEGQEENPDIQCAIISSTVCVVLEEDDDPAEVRALMIAGLREAVQTELALLLNKMFT